MMMIGTVKTKNSRFNQVGMSGVQNVAGYDVRGGLSRQPCPPVQTVCSDDLRKDGDGDGDCPDWTALTRLSGKVGTVGISTYVLE